MHFSVLIPLYIKNKAEEVALTLRSIWDDQALKPDEIVIVKDGPLEPSLDDFLQEQAKKLPISFVVLETAQGLGNALRHGVPACKNEIIARMDGDDIAKPNRFSLQIPYLEQHPEIGILGGNISEFCDDPTQIKGHRIVPQNMDEILKFIRFRNPFNHMTVCFRKSLILENGNYIQLAGYEDYWLWARCLSHGVIGANLPDILVNARTGGMVSRRKGMKIVKADIKLSHELHKLGIISFPGMIRNILLRIILLSIPVPLLGKIYQKFLRN